MPPHASSRVVPGHRSLDGAPGNRAGRPARLPDGARRIFSNSQNLWLDHTYYNEEVNWPAYFVTFAVKAFAALIAKPVTDQTDLAASLKVEAWGRQDENEQGGAFATAAKIDAMQKPGETVQSSPLVDARFS